MYINPSPTLVVGAVAYFGGSVDVSWHPPAIMAVGINKELATGNFKRIGDVLFAGQMYLMKNYSDSRSARENFIWYHLLGDITLLLPYQ